jgi:hypothetical protein
MELYLLPPTSSWHGAELSKEYVFMAYYLIKYRTSYNIVRGIK